MKNYSSKNSYSTSSNERLSSSIIQSRIRKAKQDKINQFVMENGYVFCEDCGVNANSGQPIDCSHDVSVKECLETGKANLSFNVFNITLRCRKCHNKHDKT